MAEPVAHVAGIELTVDGKHMRQRCSWCGVVLIDQNLELVAVQMPEDGSDPPPVRAWPAGEWVDVEPGHMRLLGDVGELYPKNSCMAAEFPAAPILSLHSPTSGERWSQCKDDDCTYQRGHAPPHSHQVQGV